MRLKSDMMGLRENWNFKCTVYALDLRNPVLNFVTFMSTRALLSWNSHSYKKRVFMSLPQLMSSLFEKLDIIVHTEVQFNSSKIAFLVFGPAFQGPY